MINHAIQSKRSLPPGHQGNDLGQTRNTPAKGPVLRLAAREPTVDHSRNPKKEGDWEENPAIGVAWTTKKEVQNISPEV